MFKQGCTHPDHKDGQTCRERAVGCSASCACCMDLDAAPLPPPPGQAAAEPAAEPELACLFCGTTADLGAAVDAGWEPYFWYVTSEGAEEQVNLPACPGCTAQYLEADPLDRGDGLQLRQDDGAKHALLQALAGAA